MRSLVFLGCVLAAAAAVSADVTPKEVTPGSAFDLIVVTFGHEVTGCHLTTPSGETVNFKPEDTSGAKYTLHEDNRLSACAVGVSAAAGDSGVWTLTAVADDGTVLKKDESISVLGDISDEIVEESHTTEGSTTYDVSEEPQESTPIQLLEAQLFDIDFGRTIETGIQQIGFRELEKCTVRLPNGEEYDVEDLNGVPGVASYADSQVYCGVSVYVTHDMVGDWQLSATETVWGYAHEERRLPFTIHVEETAAASSPTVTVSEGNDFYLQLASSASDPATCHLEPPHAGAEDRIQVDESRREQCGFVVKKVSGEDEGVWYIKYGSDVVYTARVELTVTVSITTEHADLILVRNQPAAELLGAADAVYCTLEDPSGTQVYHGFGQCQLELERVTLEHEGVWKMRVATPGRVIAEEHNVAVKVSEPEAKPSVTTSVQVSASVQRVLCSLQSAHALRSCVFRNGDRVLVSAQGVGEEGYKYYGGGSSLVNGVYHHSCGLEFGAAEPRGVWRCALETEDDTHYGFLSTETDSEHATPALTAHRASATLVAGDAAALGCAAHAPLRYCYFRSRNGTIYSVEPGTSHPLYSYSGAGLDAGECGIRLTGVALSDAGRWSCHVGLVAETDELTAGIQVVVKEKLSARQEHHSAELEVTAQVWDHAALDYCRFVRIDGVGFTNAHLPINYTDISDLRSGFCGIRISGPNIVEHHQWTVVARLVQHRDEISAVTQHSIVIPVSGGRAYSGYVAFYCFVTLFGALLILAGVMMMTRRTREWTHSRASLVRSSIRRSFGYEEPHYFTRKPVDIVKAPLDIADGKNIV